MSVDVSIIIVNYNTWDLVRNCVKSVVNQPTKYSYEVIIVDNASLEDCCDIIDDVHLIKIIKNKENLGFGSANNIGAQNANGRYLLFLNSDTIIYRDILSVFIEYYEKISSKHKIGALGLILFGEDGYYRSSYGSFPYLKSQLISTDGFFCKAVDVIIGADMFVKKDIFDKFGGFDQNIFLYEEELELQYRMARDGFFSFLIPHDGIIHLCGRSSTKIFMRICQFKSSCYIVKKHRNYLYYVFFRLQYVLKAIYNFRHSFYTIKEKVNYLSATLTYSIVAL